MSTVAIVDYGSGNLRSAEKSFARAARDAGHDRDIRVTADPEQVRRADRVVLPGVGAFADCRAGLKAVAGMGEALEEAVIRQGRPFFGICVGMQLMADEGREHGVTTGFGWIGGCVEPIEPGDPTLKIPHMGWNTLDRTTAHPCFDGIDMGADGLHAYFVHAYQFKANDPSMILATTEYGTPLTAAIGRDNMIGTQFHPEKSQQLGLALIRNFLEWSP